MSIRWKILGIFLILALTPMLLLRWNGQRGVRDMGESIAKDVRSRVVQRTAGELTRFLENNQGMLAREQKFIELALRSRAMEIEKRIAAGMPPDEPAVSLPPEFSTVLSASWRVTVFEKGVPVIFPAPEPGTADIDVFDPGFYRQVMEGNGVTWSPALYVPLTPSPVFIAAMPIRSGGRQAGITAFVMPVDAFLNGNRCLRTLPGDVTALFVQAEPGAGDASAVHLVARRSDGKWQTARSFSEPIPEDGIIRHIRRHETAPAVTQTPNHLVAYGCMDGCRTLMILKISLKEAVSEADALKTRILDGTRQVLDRNGVILWFITVVVSIAAFFMSAKVTDHIRQLDEAAREIAGGNLQPCVRIRTGDELESLGHAFNEMAEGVKKQLAVESALAAAREIQQNLLPPRSPHHIEGLDIAGKSVYCDATGGDYFDYMDFDEVCCRSSDHITIALGDVSGHGIPAALLMASARSLLRSRITRRGGLGDVITDVNRLLIRDTADTGQFMTLFLMDIHPGNRAVKWARAGHDPAMVYLPESRRFEWLGGKGTALGVMEEAAYNQYSASLKEKGQIFLMGTDGIWETMNSDGEMFGKERVQQIIQAHHHLPAAVILDALFKAVDEFRGTGLREDDVTAVVVKWSGGSDGQRS